ncbi:MAG: AMP-binding protein [Acidimicrobiales bacterium]|nr:AMP-binding protein [Acidimicrobiales bacterium]
MTTTEPAPDPVATPHGGGRETVPGTLLERARATPDRVALRHKQLGRWVEITWADYAESSRRFGLGLASLGVEVGDRVAIQSENRPEWAYADIGTQGIGAIAVGVYPTSPAAELEYLLNHSESSVLFAEDEEQLDKVLECWDRVPGLRTVVVFDTRGIKQLDDPRIITHTELVERGAALDGGDFDRAVASLSPDEVAVQVYTSGTTGPPKGAMLSHHNLAFGSRVGREAWGISDRDEILSYLPMCHVLERILSVVSAVHTGYVVNFGEGPEFLQSDLHQVQPTYFVGVPRIWERMMAGIEVRQADATPLKQLVYRLCISQGRAVAARRMAGRFGVLDRIRYFVCWLLLYRPLRTQLGLARCRSALSGAAPIAPQVLEFFWSIGVPVREGYGQTENTAVGTVVPSDDVRIGTVGKPLPHSELRLADDGEILTRSEGTFLGYHKNPEATADTIDEDGWLHTGDIGTLDDDGFLTITDRKKDIIITAGGKNISPSEIENLLKVSPFMREAIVIGDRRKYLSALIGIEADTVGDWATRHGLAYTTYADLSSKDEVRDLVAGIVEGVNDDVARVEQIKEFRLLTVELDQDDGQLTATQKVKRAAISEQFADVIEEMYR